MLQLLRRLTVRLFTGSTSPPQPPKSYQTTSLAPANTPRRKPIILNDNDLEESFIKGGGKGGQKVNKAANAVCLKHLPSQIVIKCHETRSLEMNRQLARKRLIERLDWLENGMQSKKGQLIQKIRRQKDRQARRSKEKHSVSDEDGTESTVDKLLSDERFAVHLRDLGSSK